MAAARKELDEEYKAAVGLNIQPSKGWHPRSSASRLDTTEICRKMGISEATFYRWKQLYGGLMPSEVKKLRQLEEKNARLRKVVADLTLDKEMLQEVIRRKL